MTPATYCSNNELSCCSDREASPEPAQYASRRARDGRRERFFRQWMSKHRRTSRQWHPEIRPTPGLGRLCFVLLLAFGSVFFFHHLGDRDVWSSHEGRAAENASMMLTHGHWALPRNCDFRPEMQKPPLYYWLVAGFARLRGGTVDALTVRLPSALAALGTVLALYFYGVSRCRPLMGMLAGIVLASMAHFTWLARVGRIDMPLTFAVTVAVLSIRRACESGPTERIWQWCLATYLAVAAGLLLKGPIALILPGSVFGVLLMWQWRTLWNKGFVRRLLRSLTWGIPLVAAVALPWYWWVGARTGGGWYSSFFWYHNVERALGSGGLRSHPWWFYAPRLAIDLLPWSVVLPIAGYVAWRKGTDRADDDGRFGLLWLGAIFLILSLASFKRADYLLPAYPGAAIFLGSTLERWFLGMHAASRRASSCAAVATLAAVLALAISGWWVYEAKVLPRDESVREYRTFAAAIRERSPIPDIVVFFRVEAHALAFHLGAPVNTVMEWENLSAWLDKPEPHLIVTSPECAAECARRMPSGRLDHVMTNAAHDGRLHEQPLVLLRTAR